MEPADLVEELISGQQHVTSVVRAASRQLVESVELMVARFLAGGRIILVGAGTSGRLALMEEAELPGTYGIGADRIIARIARSTVDQSAGSDAAEDDADLGRADVVTLAVSQDDVVLAVSASGTTPYTLAAAESAAQAGAAVIAITNAADSRLAALADVAVEVPTGPEVVIGSTRLAAGTAQKLVLNTLTTATMVRIGRVHDRFMVDVVPANAKLVRRVADVVAESCGVSEDVAMTALAACGHNPRAAIVHLLTGLTPEDAARLAAAHRSVRDAIASAG
jgi:N-acetylmuramic acid 6-phosphate etherase